MECGRGNKRLLYLLSLLSLANLLVFLLFAEHWNNNNTITHNFRHRTGALDPPSPNHQTHIISSTNNRPGSTDQPNDPSLNPLQTGIISSTSTRGEGSLAIIPAAIPFPSLSTTSKSNHGNSLTTQVDNLQSSSAVSSFAAPPGGTQDIFNIFGLFGHHQPIPSSKAEALKAPRLDRLWNVWNMTFPIDKPKICHQIPEVGIGGSHHVDQGNKPEVVAVMAVVISAASHQTARMAIRDTWGSKLLSSNLTVRLVFLVGHSSQPRIQEALISEDQQHADIVQANFGEDYRNLTLKSVLLLRWVALRCPHARFILKVDDDVFLHPGNFLALLERHRDLKKRIFGRLATRWRPIRDEHSHYFVPKTVWMSPIYPDFVAGPAYVVSGDAVTTLLEQVSSVPFFFLEDVYVTGILAQRGGVRRLNHNGFCNQRTPLNPCLYHKLISSHHVNATRMRDAWRMLEEYGAEEEGCWEVRCVTRVLGLCLEWKKVAVDFGRATPGTSTTTTLQVK